MGGRITGGSQAAATWQQRKVFLEKKRVIVYNTMEMFVPKGRNDVSRHAAPVCLKV